MYQLPILSRKTKFYLTFWLGAMGMLGTILLTLYGMLSGKIYIVVIGAIGIYVFNFLFDKHEKRIDESIDEFKGELVQSEVNPTVTTPVIKHDELDLTSLTKECPQCAESIKMKAKVCRYCEYIFTEAEVAKDIELANEKALNSPPSNRSEKKAISGTNVVYGEMAFQEEKIPKCPYCSSKYIQSYKKGYGFVKGLTGVTLAGPLGLLGGFVGSRKTQMSCLSCGNRWNL